MTAYNPVGVGVPDEGWEEGWGDQGKMKKAK
jgi:hypothetical protein